jgi:hypothetical protein
VVALVNYQYVYYDVLPTEPHETIALKCPSCKEKDGCDNSTVDVEQAQP